VKARLLQPYARHLLTIWSRLAMCGKFGPLYRVICLKRPRLDGRVVLKTVPTVAVMLSPRFSQVATHESPATYWSNNVRRVA